MPCCNADYSSSVIVRNQWLYFTHTIILLSILRTHGQVQPLTHHWEGTGYNSWYISATTSTLALEHHAVPHTSSHVSLKMTPKHCKISSPTDITHPTTSLPSTRNEAQSSMITAIHSSFTPSFAIITSSQSSFLLFLSSSFSSVSSLA